MASPPSSHFASLALSSHDHFNLLEDDMTITSSSGFGDYSDGTIELPSQPSTSQAPPPPPPQTQGYSYGGSMGVAEAPSSPTTPQRSSTSRPSSRGATAALDTDEDDEDSWDEDTKAANVRARAERDALRGMNAVLEQVIGNLKAAQSKMESFEETVKTSHALMDLYVRLSSQADHSTEMLLNTEWSGTTIEGEQRAAIVAERERLAEEEREREEAAALAKEQARQEAEERKRAAAAAPPPKRGTGRGRGATRGAVNSSFSSTAGSLSGIGRGGPPASSLAGRGTAPVTGVRGVRGIKSRAVTSGRGRAL